MDGVRAVVLTYGTGGEYEPLLESLLREGLAPDHIVVIHNPAKPGERLPAVPRGCEVLSANQNLGYAAGMNLGIDRQLDRDGDLLLVLTHDARLHPGALPTLVDAARLHPAYGVLGPTLVVSGADTPFSFGGMTRANGTMTHIHDRPRADNGIARCDWVDGGTLLIRVDLLKRIGGFDERFWMYCEDAEFCLRASRAGFVVGVASDAQASQSPGSGKRLGPWAYLMTRNGAAYAYRARGGRALAFVIGRAGLLISLNLIRATARGLRFRKGSPSEPWALAVGTARGVLDFCRGRWGPPPSLPGSGDVVNVGDPRKAAAGDVR